MIDMDIFSSAKLLKHLDRVQEWRQTGQARPILIGLDLTNLCNHRCPACNGAPGLLENNNASIPFARLEALADEFAALGVKAVSLGGGGDASCHPRLPDALRLFKARGIETALFTNGQLIRDDVGRAIVECCTWVRFSLDADSPEMFKATHGMDEGDFEKVKTNIARVVDLRQETGSPVVLGGSFLIGSHTLGGIYGVSRLARDLGLDYIRLRPFFTWDGALPFRAEETDVVLAELQRSAAAFNSDRFQVSYPAERTGWVKNGTPPLDYARCNIHHFTTEISADLKVYLCCHTKEKSKYLIGDLARQSFLDMWNSEHRRNVYNSIDFKDCATPCMMGAHNRLLHIIESPIGHENFL